MEHEMLDTCRERFEHIEGRLDRGDAEFKEHGERLVEMKTDISYLTKSLDGVTKALWAVACSIATTLLGFVVWYIQNLKH